MAADENNFKERLAAFQKDLNAILDKHQFHDLYRQIIEKNAMKEAKRQMTKRVTTAYEKNEEREQ